MRIRDIVFTLVLLGVFVFVATCSKKSPTSSNPPDDPGGTDTNGVVTDAERAVALNAIDSVCLLQGDISADSLATALVAFLNSRDEYEEAGRDGTSVWARFVDGRMVMIPNNRFVTESSDTLPPGFAAPSIPPDVIDLVPETIGTTQPVAQPRTEDVVFPAARTARVPSYGLPHSVETFTRSTLGHCYTPGVDLAQWWLGSAGYRNFQYSSVRVDNLKTVTNCGVFYIDSHGGVCESRIGQFLTGIWTDEEWSEANDAYFKVDLDSARLVYMYALGASGANCTNQWRYAFTGKFVAKYMTFAPNSLIYISACNSDSPSLKAGFTTAGASVYMGWTMPVTALWSNIAGQFLIDRMLGANQYPIRENPSQRPFDITSLYEDLKTRGWDWDHVTGSELRITELKPGFGLLAPSLRHAYVINYSDTLFLTGFFGEDPGSKGHVYVDGVEQTIYRWEPTFIWTSIPSAGRGWAGPITVELDPIIEPSGNVGRRKSNTITLSGWRGLFVYEMRDAGTLKGEILTDVEFRVDVHAFREFPHTTPTPNPYLVFGGIPINCQSQGYASGSFIYPVPNSDPPEVLTWNWTGTTTDIWLLSPEVIRDQPGQLLVQGTIQGAARTMEFLFYVHAGGNQLLMETVESSLYGLQGTREKIFTVPFDMYDIPPVSISVNFDTNWNLVGERNTLSTCCSVNPDTDGSTNDVFHSLYWETIPIEFPPNPQAPQ